GVKFDARFKLQHFVNGRLRSLDARRQHRLPLCQRRQHHGWIDDTLQQPVVAGDGGVGGADSSNQPPHIETFQRQRIGDKGLHAASILPDCMVSTSIAALLGSSTQSSRRRTVNGRMTRPYSDCLQSPRSKSATDQMNEERFSWVIKRSNPQCMQPIPRLAGLPFYKVPPPSPGGDSFLLLFRRASPFRAP